jgi:TonB-dependent receptor
MLKRFGRALIVPALLVLAAPARPASAQTGLGTIDGTVLDAERGEPLPGAKVVVEGTVLTTATDRDGRFRLATPPGRQVLTISYLGWQEQRVEVDVAADQTLSREIRLLGDDYIVEETVTVTAEGIRDAQARALNQQRTAPNITNVVSADQIGQFPDTNAVEAVQRIPGLSIQRDQGEGRYIIVRGTEPRLNSLMINGERVPSPDAELRQVAADVIPADLLEKIEVSKALTPDMDADAIGGAVNLVMKQAPNEPVMLFTAATGYNALNEDFAQGQGAFTWGQRMADRKLGVVVSGSTLNTNRGSDNFEPEYDEGDLDTLEIRDYRINRKRSGLNLAMDYRASASSNYYLRGVYNYFSDQEYRRQLVNVVSDGELERNLKDRFESERIGQVSVGGDHLLGSGWLIDYHFTGSYAENDRPDEIISVFKQEEVEFAPNVGADFIDPDNIQANPLNEDFASFTFDEQEFNDDFNRDRDFVAAANLRVPLRATEGFAGFLKVGGKYRDKNNRQDTNQTLFGSEDDVRLEDVADLETEADFFDGRYRPGFFALATTARGFRAQPGFEGEFNHESDAGDFDASENVAALYGMAELHIGPRLMLLPGIRYERTSTEYTGFEAVFDEDGEYASTNRLSGSDDYGQVLPMFHARYGLTPNSNLRAAVTRTLARPNYFDIAPYQLVFSEDDEIERGNPALEPTTAWNVDILGEHYLQSVGVIQAGFFYKNLTDNIFPFTFEEDRDGRSFRVVQPQNGESGSLRGVELALQSPLRFLPSPFDGLGVYANYTFTDSSATFPGGREATLPGQSRHVGNLSVWYEKFGLMARASVNFHGSYIDQVGESAAEDVYYDDHSQVDFSVSQQITRQVRVFADFVNLSNAPLRYYEGVADRPIQEEYYRWWSTFGVKVSF